MASGGGPRRLARVLHQLYTEHDSPTRQAAAVGLGLYIGCTPLYGLHFALSVLLASVFRLNRLKVYIAANVSNPLIAPALIAVETQMGSWMTRGAWYGPRTVRDAQLLGVARDLLLGSVVVGGLLGVVGAMVTYAIVSAGTVEPQQSQHVQSAAERYLRVGFVAWQFATGKLRLDPVYQQIVAGGRLPTRGTLVDLGCGQGLMLSLLASARPFMAADSAGGDAPQGAGGLRLHGIENRSRQVRRARQALGDDATILVGDIRHTVFPEADAVLLLDVLHLMTERDQNALLARAVEALRPGGLLVVREADASAGWRFRTVRIGNWLCRAVQGQWRRRFYFRTAVDWERRLTSLGLTVERGPSPVNVPFGNVLLYARRETSTSEAPPQTAQMRSAPASLGCHSSMAPLRGD